jgi:hypothetical protein
MPSFFSWKYKLNYLPFQILDSNPISPCTSAGSVLKLCKVSQKSNKPFRRSCAYKVHDPPFRESISWIISPLKFWTATIFLHAHLQVVYYKCVKFYKNPISCLEGVALTRYMDGRTGWFLYTPYEELPCNRYAPLPQVIGTVMMWLKCNVNVLVLNSSDYVTYDCVRFQVIRCINAINYTPANKVWGHHYSSNNLR